MSSEEKVAKIGRPKKIKTKPLKNIPSSNGNMDNDYSITYKEKLLPLLEDPLFSYRIGQRPEFYENGYIDYIEGNITEKSFKERADILCNLPFSLAPHQRFVKNFMSFSTPYNSLLLYHGLGTGKTCSAMGISEEMRNYMNKIGSKQKIFIIASPNVQDNFKNQLFNKYKLKKLNGKWNLESCVGTNLIDEVTQNVAQTFKREKLIKSVDRLIRKYYTFIGYQEFANLFNRKILKSLDKLELDDKQKKQIIEKRIQSFFGNRLIVIDEAHNLRPSNKKEKGVGNVLTQIVENTTNMRLLLLSATPMYNSPQEIIWLTNLMCKNDNIPILEVNEVFDKKGNLKTIMDDGGNVVEIGAQKVSQKMSGHVSFIRGENPFTFPFSLYPSEFDRDRSVKSLNDYPQKMMNGKSIIQPLEYLDCYMTKVGKRQEIVYQRILEELISNLTGDDVSKLEDMEGFGYNFIQPLLDALIISFPSFDEDDSKSYLSYTGKKGLESVMDFSKKSTYNTDYSYKKDILDKYGRLFSKKNIGEYSGKIKAILNNVENSDGIIMIYSQFLEGSLIPIALALEEEGYERTNVANGTNLFSTTGRTQLKKKDGFNVKGKYAFISGNNGYSPNNAKELAKIVADSNKDGDEIKIVLISRAGSEGLDFKNIRQLHILEPWYNMKRVEQIIGRGVRNCSHKSLPFEKRNVSLYLHASTPFTKKNKHHEEPADLYVYRYAERGSVKIGVVSRLAKEVSVDCLINNNMLNFDAAVLNLNVSILLPSRRKILYQVGDKPYTSVCDYMKKCSYVCRKGSGDIYNKKEMQEIRRLEEQDNTLEELNDRLIEPSFYESGISTLITKISGLFLEDYAFSFDDIHRRIKGYAGRSYSYLQIAAALNKMVENKNIKIMDNFGRYGTLIKIDNMYFFNPSEILATPNDYFEIKTPVEFKHEKLVFKQSKKKRKKDIDKKKTIVGSKTTKERMLALIERIQEKLTVAFGKQEKINNDKNWYRLCAFAIPEMIMMENVSIQTLEKIIVHHFMDFDTNYNIKKEVVEFLYSDNVSDLETTLKPKQKHILKIISNYTERALVLTHKTNKNRKLVGMFDNDYTFNYYSFSDKGLVIASPEDINDFKNTIANFQNTVVGKFADYVGFVSVFRGNRLTFKVKYMKQKRSKGARCDQAGKSNSIALIKQFRDETIQGVERTAIVSQQLGKIITNAVCVYQELLLRQYNENKHENRIWFLPLEHYKQSNIEKITL